MKLLAPLLLLAALGACSESPDPDLDSPMAEPGDMPEEGLYTGEDRPAVEDEEEPGNDRR